MVRVPKRCRRAGRMVRDAVEIAHLHSTFDVGLPGITCLTNQVLEFEIAFMRTSVPTTADMCTGSVVLSRSGFRSVNDSGGMRMHLSSTAS